MNESLRQTAQNLVDGFFIGGGGDTLRQDNLSKSDLVQAVERALDLAWDDGYQRGLNSAKNTAKF